MSKADQEAIAFGALALIFLAVSVGAFARARNGGPKSSWRGVGLFGFVLCSFLVFVALRFGAVQGV
ncbi:hypothetical protein [uncultured Jatrophihabitans sp.]|uniref:hypothetical protein n=1 Tax=uncultured Jatrophihabitans sp. TaxID=1610747 RepID=UPI0035CAA6FA